MPDESQQAANRLWPWAVGRDMYGHGYRQFREDLLMTARQFAIEHANDVANATPLTGEILQASGWTNSFGSWGHPRVGFRLSQSPHPPGLWSVSGEVDDIGGYIETVGNLCDVLRGLNIEVATVVPKESETPPCEKT